MKTFAFYSYKGGQGRTMALANIGVCLARLGKDVVMLDLDVEAPGLASKFGKSVFNDADIESGIGVLPYIKDYTNKRTKNIREYMVKIDCEHGKLSVIPAGPAHSKNYWRDIGSYDWLDSISLKKDSNPLFQLKQKVQEMEPAPDYLLVDTRCGLTEIAAFTMRMFAEKAVCLFGNDPENIAGTNFALDVFERLAKTSETDRSDRFQNTTKLEEIIPVYSRFPVLCNEVENALEEKREELKLKERNLSIEKIITCLEVENKFRLSIPPTGNISESNNDGSSETLMRDYFQLITRLDPKIFQSASAISEQLGLSIDYSKESSPDHKIFRLKQSQGLMVNMSDSARNVSFKVDTFCAMLSEIHAGIVGELKGSVGLNKDDISKKFEVAGYQCGASFGRSLVEDIWIDEILSDYEKIQSWLKFDSGVGFGQLSLLEPVADDKEIIQNGRILISNNFLTEGRQPEDPDLCPIMTGYIQGVLEKILKAETVIVSHSNEYHAQTSAAHIDSFDFEVKRK